MNLRKRNDRTFPASVEGRQVKMDVRPFHNRWESLILHKPYSRTTNYNSYLLTRKNYSSEEKKEEVTPEKHTQDLPFEHKAKVHNLHLEAFIKQKRTVNRSLNIRKLLGFKIAKAGIDSDIDRSKRGRSLDTLPSERNNYSRRAPTPEFKRHALKSKLKLIKRETPDLSNSIFDVNDILNVANGVINVTNN